MKRRPSRCFTCKRDNSHFLRYLKNPSIMLLGIILVFFFFFKKIGFDISCNFMQFAWNVIFYFLGKFLEYSFLFFLENRIWHSMQICLLRRQFAWNVISYFLCVCVCVGGGGGVGEGNKKNIINLSSAEFAHRVLSVIWAGQFVIYINLKRVISPWCEKKELFCFVFFWGGGGVRGW